MDFAEMLGRMHRAYVRRVAEGDPEDLARMIALADDFQDSVGEAVRAMRAKLGWSWGDLAKAVPSPSPRRAGKPITRQALQARYGAPADA